MPARYASYRRPARASKARRRMKHSVSPRLLHDLEQAGGTHAAADAHRHDDVLGLAATALDQRVAGAARAGHAERMADRDRAAVDVELVVRDAELVAAVEHLNGEGLVQLPQV